MNNKAPQGVPHINMGSCPTARHPLGRDYSCAACQELMHMAATEESNAREGMVLVPYGLLLDLSDHAPCLCGTVLEDFEGETETIGSDECLACTLDSIITTFANPAKGQTDD